MPKLQVIDLTNVKKEMKTELMLEFLECCTYDGELL